MYFSPTIGGFNLYTKWHLIPTQRPYVAPPEIRTNTVEIPGRHGVLDFTEAFGGPYFGNSTGEWEFYIMQNVNPATGHYYTGSVARKSWAQILAEIVEELHGEKLTCTLEGDSHTYTGRFAVSKYNPGSDYSTITISYDIDGNWIFDDPYD